MRVDFYFMMDKFREKLNYDQNNSKKEQDKTEKDRELDKTIKELDKIKKKFEHERGNNIIIEGIILPDLEYALNKVIDDVLEYEYMTQSIFNILYCIYVLHKFLDIMHFDCHFGNFRVSKAKNRAQHYKIGDKNYTMRTKYYIRIFDFDHSTKIKKFTDTNTMDNSSFDSLSCNKLGCY